MECVLRQDPLDGAVVRRISDRIRRRRSDGHPGNHVMRSVVKWMDEHGGGILREMTVDTEIICIKISVKYFGLQLYIHQDTF